MDSLFSVLSKILEPITGPINRHIGYVFQLRSNVDGLHDKVESLTVARDNLQSSIEDAETLKVEEVKKHVLEWKVKADTAISEAETPLKNGQEEAQRCCSLRLATRYRISKKAAKTTAGIAQLLEQKRELGETIARPRQLHQIDRPVPVEGYEAKSRTKILKEVMGALLDPSITMVGVCGMGGIGKTTLAEEVQRQAKSSFDQVIIVIVTATPEVKRIQDKIAGFFHEPKLEDDIDVRAARLHQILENRKVLIIMDDLWSVLDRYKVGIPSWNDGKGCKLLLTSRNEDILSNMGSQKNFPLGFLSKEDSRSLFEKKVNRIEDHDIAEQILAKCDGYPLLIVTVGALIRNKAIHHWKNAVTQLSKFLDGEAVEKVHSVLESSYDNLDKETKEIFLLIGISSKSDTTMLNLLRYALGLGLFKDCTLCEARNCLEKMIDDLKACSLLEDYKQGNLKMHDLVREIAIRIARRNKYAFRERDGKVLKEWPSSGETSGCTIVSVPQSSDIRQLPGDLGCPDVELLVLYFNWHPVEIPDSTFEGTAKLKVIHFARMELASLPIRPSSHSLANLHTLCLEDCSLLDLTTITQLQRLEILSLRGSDLEELPSEIGKLTRMKVLDLSDCSKLRFIPVGVISKLTSLEELLMRNSFENWEVEEEGTDGSNARLSELKCLPWLELLVIRVSDTRALSKDFFFDRLERFQILIGTRLGGWRPEFDQGSEITKTLKLMGDMNADLFQKVRELSRESEILHLNGSMTIHLSELEKEGFPNLKELHVDYSHMLQQVVDCKREGATVYFPLLESLTLSRLKSMVTICKGRPAPESFSQMKRLKIDRCDQLKNLFSLSAVRSLPQLEEIIISACGGMEALFVAEGSEIVEFPRLRCLDLHRVRLKCFLAKENPIGLGSSDSENAEIELRPFFSDKVALPSLETLRICFNDSIEMIWPSGSLGRFQNLKSLTVDRCNALEEIYQFRNGVTNDRMILALTKLALSNLPRLKRIWKEDSSGRYHSLQNLESISITGCESLENLFPPVVAITLSQLDSIEVRSCGKLTQIVAEEEEISSVDGPCSLFPLLTSLTIEDCPKANIFGSGQPHCPNQQPFSFLEEVVPKLKEICIEGRIFKSMSSKYLANLESLRLSSTRGGTAMEVSQLENMPLLRKLYIRHSRITKLWTSGTDQPSSIRIVELERVSGLRHVWRPESQMDLDILKLTWCYNLISLAPSPSSASFRRLSTLELFGCGEVTDLVNPTTANTMANLVTLKISYCQTLKEIVVAEEQQDDLTTPVCIVFHKLKTLELRALKSLQGFCISGSYSFKFPCLEEVSVRGCPGMRIFCNGEVSTPKLHSVGSLPLWRSDLNTIIKLQYEDGIIHIEHVRLSRYPELVERWGRDLPFKPFSRRIYSLEVDQLPLLLPVVAVPSNVLPALSTLQVLVVKKCDSVEEIFDLDGMDHRDEDHVHLMSKLRVLELNELPKLNHIWNKDPLERLGMKNLQVLKVHHCGTLTHIFTLNVALGFVALRELYVRECPRVKVIIEQQSDEQPPADGYSRTIFQCLKKVQLENLPSLMQFFSGDDVLRCPELTSVLVEGCPGMCLLGSTVLSTEKDENIIIHTHKDRPCDAHEPDWCILNKQVEVRWLEEPTVKWNGGMGNAWHEIVPQSVLLRLQVVKLTGFPAHHELLPSDFVQGMPNLRKFSIADSLCKQMLPRGPKSISETQPAVSFKMLTCLELFDLPELSQLVDEDSQSGSLFQHLQILKVSKCKRLTRLITFIMAKGLVNLEKMAVEECERMTEVVSSNGEEVGVEIVFEKLKSLKLRDLPCLASFSSGDCTFNFPCLDEVIVRECPNMKTFAKNAPSTPKLDYVQIAGEEEDDVDPWRLVEAGLNGTIEKLFAEKNTSSICQLEIE